MASRFEVGTRCWQPDDSEGWVAAEIKSKSIDGDKVTLEIALENGNINTVICAIKDFEDENSTKLPPLANPPILEASEDLTNLSYLNEPAVLYAIKLRYQQLSIYTYSGIVLIATNPFQRVDNLYSSDIVQMYSGKNRGELEPHLFAIAEDAYRCMLRDGQNQTIVVSGESGAGKTVSAKYIMRYFATVEEADRPHERSKSASLSKTEEQILATNPIMEAFGNAKTTRNDNSSRFGKYIEILFDSAPDIIGAKIRTYLLERSRLVFQPPNERNYHIFYQLCAGASDEEREAFSLLPVEEFQYLRQGGDPIIPHVNDAEEFSATKQALSTIGIDDITQHSIFEILSALLHIGNIQINAGRTDSNLPSDEPSLVLVAKLLGIDPFTFAKWTTKRQLITRSEKIVTNVNFKQAVVIRDSVSKYVYSALFDWLVSATNKSLASPEVTESAKSFIGVLDIYGFEHFQRNSFEQFCINYANEKLQQEFNQHVFKLEQDEYVKEKIEWTFIEFSDNQPCIDLIEARIGILSLLDEESRLPAGSDDSWIQKLYTNFDTDKFKTYFKKPRFGKTAFTVHHYAMDVTYESEGFIEKNRDTVPDEQLDLLMTSSNEFLKTVLTTSIDAAKANNAAAPAAVANGKPGPMKRGGAMTNRKPTLGGIFKTSLIELMDTINSTNVHYIRCIKPNEAKEAWKFDGPMVLGQLRACGVLETIRISCEGFPTRSTFEEFVDRYYMLINSENLYKKDVREISDIILAKSITLPDKYQLGLTKIFFRAGMLAHMENLRANRLNECATLIQKNLRRFYYRENYLRTRQSIIKAQAAIRGFLARDRMEKIRLNTAATKIQSVWRMHSDRTQFLEIRSNLVLAQAAIRGYLTRNSLLHITQTAAATAVQRSFRGYLARKQYQRNLHDIVVVQSLFRRKMAGRELKTLKQEATSVNHFKEVSYRLENKVVELTQTLATRTEENKKLMFQIDSMESQLTSWQARHDAIQERTFELETQADSASEYLKRAQALEVQMNELSEQHSSVLKNKNDEVETLRQSLSLRVGELEQALEDSQKQKEEAEMSLTREIEELKNEVERLLAAGAAAASVFSATDGANGSSINILSMQTAKPARALKRHSLTADSSFKDSSLLGTPNDFKPRPTSMIASSPGYFSAFGEENGEYHPNGDYDHEMEDIFEKTNVVLDEATKGLITTLMIPVPSSHNPVNENEILFPAHMFNLLTTEMWRLGFVKESESLLGRMMHNIQEKVVGYEGIDILGPGSFWLSNVHEMYSFVCIAEMNILDNQNSEIGEVEYKDYERLIALVKSDMENLEFNIYHAIVTRLKAVLFKMIVPAVIESQSLPGFIISENNRFLSKVLGNNSPSYKMDDLIDFLSRVSNTMKLYYLEPHFIQHAITELLKLVGVASFNDLIGRRNYLSWKRGLQISYNITRIEEWCKANEIADGTLKLEHLMQATKLLQLKKSSKHDIDIIFDICWMLNPTQINKLIREYHVADYEEPIKPEIKHELAKRAADVRNESLFLDSVPLDNSGPFDIGSPRELTNLQTYMPSYLQVPTLKRIVQLSSSAVNY
ncbi:P-loop containing nucleoside triphosphate hydrolase protein, partial [Lipomyces oligophaga]|uniref:P-loop containing nucleoside triphosphate hydrolase protein n=1 Tax=Lipomyces oligophaga TaxID=45792 RepID=UPI0034CD958E